MSTMTARALLISASVAAALLPTSICTAKLAVFVDGRVLKVEDAQLVGSDIVLELPGGGMVTVSAVEIDRVIADEVEQPTSRTAIVDPSCPTDWVSDTLPNGLPFRESIEAASKRTNLHPLLVAAIVQTESDFDPRAVSRAGAAGLMQLMPATAADHRVIDVFDPSDNLRGGTSQLRAMLDRFQSLTLALAAYNSGATTVDRYHGVPPYRETRDYVRRVIDLFCPEE
jgi:soluble lytic murein transglycosylase-like protein